MSVVQVNQQVAALQGVIALLQAENARLKQECARLRARRDEWRALARELGELNMHQAEQLAALQLVVHARPAWQQDEAWSALPHLLAWRMRAGLSQTELARRAGVATSSISKLESKGARAYGDTVERLAEALGITVAQLLSEPGSKQG